MATLVLSVGSRLAMRVVALLNAEAKGTLTDAQQIVGAITVEWLISSMAHRSKAFEQLPLGHYLHIGGV